MNLDKLTYKAYSKIYDLDKSFVGTVDYIGIAYYWAYEYRHYLRDATIYQRKKIHDTFLSENLEVYGESFLHFEIIKKYIKN